MIFPSIRTASILLAGLSATAWAAPAADQPAPEQAELAERLLQIGQRLAGATNGAPVAAALADAANRMFAGNTRLLREAIDLRLSLGQRDDAIRLLAAFRRIDPLDQIAQVQSIDLYADTLQTADAKADYLTKVSSSASIPAEVRSHAALLLSGVQSQRGLDDEAQKAIDTALALNPLNPRALQLKLDSAMRSGDSTLQVHTLVNLVLAEPMQFGGYARIAETLARVGASAPASDLYGQLFTVLDTTTYLPTPDDACNYAAILLADNKPKDADTIIQNQMKIDPRIVRVHYLKILSAWQKGNQGDAQTAFNDARTICLGNLMGLQRLIDPSTPKMSDNTKVALPDVKAAVKLIAAKKDPRTAERYLEALGDLAWLEVYFGGHLPEPTVMDGVNALAGENSVMANRINGWAAIATSQNDEAKVKLSAVADRDPLSQLGMLVLQYKATADKAAAVKAGDALLEKLPTDAWSAMVRWSLRDAGALTLHTSDYDAVVAEAAKLPRNWINFARDGRSYYFVTVDVEKPTVQTGEPIIATVEVQNASDHPLVVGPGGAIEQAVSLDAEVRGAQSQTFPAVAIAKLTGQLVLQPNDSTRTTVRLDDANLAGFLAENPRLGLSIFISAVTNPIVRGNAVAPGPGGYRAQSRNVVDRPPEAYSHEDVRQQLTAQLHDSSAVERLHAVLTIGACAAWMNSAGADDHQFAPAAVAQLQEAAAHDASPTVRAVAWQQLALEQDDAGRMKSIQTMLASPDFETRLIGCVMTMNRPIADRKTLLAPLANDSDDVVKRLAAAILQLPEAPAKPATPLATQP